MADAGQDESARPGFRIQPLFCGHVNVTRKQAGLAIAALPLAARGRYFDSGFGRGLEK